MAKIVTITFSPCIDKSTSVSARFKKNNIPFEIKYIHETGHYPMIEKPAAFNEALEKIMQEIKQDSAK